MSSLPQRFFTSKLFSSWSFEARLILVVALVQFVNILDFMMVMPLGPDFAKALGIPTHNIGLIGGIYTFSASVTGIIAALFLDRFARKSALLFSMAGLIIATAAAAFSWNMETMLGARVLAGVFGGPVTSLAIAMVADHVPPERRGAAMGKVMGAFAAASVLGVPFGLEIAARFGWYAPFLALSMLATVVLYLGYRFLPAHGNVIVKRSAGESLRTMLSSFKNPNALRSFGFMGLAMMSGFMIIPNISSHLQFNMGYPRDGLGILYFCGGAVSFFSMRFVGKMLDRVGATKLSLAATAVFAVALYIGYIQYKDFHAYVLPAFVLFMVAMTSRSVTVQTLSSKVPKPSERGGYMSLQSSITHMASALGAFFSSHVLVETPSGGLEGMEILALIALIISLVIPILIFQTERALRNHAY